MTTESNRESVTAELSTLLSHLDETAVLVEEYGCYVALTADKSAIFSCPASLDGSPERHDDDNRHLNWAQVTAPDPGFIDIVNDTFGTSFDWHQFAGR